MENDVDDLPEDIDATHVTDSDPDSTAEALRLASDPATPHETLLQLFKGRQRRVWVALVVNPNTPVELLLQLLPIFPRQFLENPALPLLLLERPDFFLDIPAEHLIMLLGCEDCPPAALAVARKHRLPEVRDPVEMHVRVAGEAGDDWQAQAEAQLAASDVCRGGFPVTLPGEAIPDWVFRVAAHCTGKLAREQVARHPDIPSALLEHLGYDTSLEVRLAVARHPRTPHATLMRLADEAEPSLRLSLLSNCALSDDLWRLLLTETPDASADLPELFQRVIRQSDTHIRQAIARNPCTPPDVLAQLACGDDSYARAVVAGNPQTPLAAREILAHDQNSWVRRAVAESPCTPAALLELLARDGDTDMRRRIAANPHTPASLLSLLANDVKSKVQATARQALQREKNPHPASLHSQMEQLTRASRFRNLFVGLASPYMPAKLLWRWAQASAVFDLMEIRWAMCYAIALNPNAGDRTLDYLAHDGNRYVRAAARATLAQRSAQPGVQHAETSRQDTTPDEATGATPATQRASPPARRAAR